MGDVEVFRDLGSPARHAFSWHLPYLTAADQEALARVAWAAEPVEHLVAQIVLVRERRNRFRWVAVSGMVALFVVAVVYGVLGLAIAGLVHLPAAPVQVGAALLVALGVCLAWAVAAVLLTRYPRSDQVLVSLLAAVRSASDVAAGDGQVTAEVEWAANAFYHHYRRSGRRRSEPRRSHRRRTKAAFRGASAIASQLARLEPAVPDRVALADDLRRALLRVSSGNWREVELLAIPSDDPWLPTMRFRVAAMLTQEPTQKIAVGITVALISVLAAVVASIVRVAFGS